MSLFSSSTATRCLGISHGSRYRTAAAGRLSKTIWGKIVEAMKTEKKESEQQIQLNRQHLTEWNDLLSQEIRVRMALERKHQQEQTQSYLEEINFRDRAVLATRQVVAIKELIKQNRLVRITMSKRHSQENQDLD
ncbi:MAG: hypothetical protein JWP57_4324 [Spirosoma sp.]|nr:hypothetical protein [Spirosoma sp.]